MSASSSHSAENLARSYKECARVCRRAGSNFYWSFFLLPRLQRRGMRALYAFLRHTDDLADNPTPVPTRRQRLEEWRQALAHNLSPDNKPPLENLSEQLRSLATVLPALADVVRHFRIPPQHLFAVVEGVEMDLQKQRYENFAELERYCELVASAVGLACIHIWGFSGPEAYEPARRSGIALQLTNILRDARADAQQDRLYLPLNDLRACNYTFEELRSGVADERFARLIALQVGRAERFYREGLRLFDWLAPAGRRAFGMMMAVYRELLAKIARRPQDVLRHRLRVSPWKKALLACRWAFGPLPSTGSRHD
jgi:phytoene synthase